MGNEKFYVWKETFAIVKARKIPSKAFAIVQDKNEITLVVEESKLDNDNVITAEKGWKIVTFDGVLPFGLVGFISNISSALAEEGISVFVISSYSTDHILVKEKDLDKAIKKLEKLGYQIEKKN